MYNVTMVFIKTYTGITGIYYFKFVVIIEINVTILQPKKT